MPLVPRPAIDALQRLGGTRAGAAVGRRAFLGVIHGIAADLGRIRGVRAVLLTGSWTNPRVAAPGYSDVDLLLTVDVPSLTDELELRASLHAAQRRWNSVAKFLKHLDYLEHRDVSLFLRGGDYYWLDAHRRFVPLVGGFGQATSERLHRAPVLARLTSSLRRWMHVSPVLMDPTFVRDDAITRRAADRLLAGVLAMRLDRDPLTPFDELVAEAIRTLPEFPGVGASAGRTPTPELVERRLEASLRVLDAHCEEVTAAFPEGPDPGSVVSDEFAPFDAAARRAGFVGGTIAEVPPPADTVFACVLTEAEPLAAIRALRASWSSIELPERMRAAGFHRPAIVTRALARASGLFWPIPEAGEVFARTASAFGPPARLPDAMREAIGIARSLHLFHRSRGHAFRVDRSADANLLRLRADLTTLAPHLRAMRGAPPLDLPALRSDAGERELLERLRAILALERGHLREVLDPEDPRR